MFYAAVNKKTGQVLFAGRKRDEVEARAKKTGVSYIIDEFDETQVRKSEVEYAAAEKKVIRARI